MVPYTISQQSITVLLGGIPKVLDTTHINYEKVKEALKSGASEEDLSKLLDTVKVIEAGAKGLIQIRKGVLFYNQKELHNYTTNKILEMLADGYDINPMLVFLENLLQNPSYRAVEELYKFLEAGNIPLSEDGCFMVYKKVRGNYMDIHSGTFDNSIGSVVTMPRWQVNEDSSVTCSAGLHVCSFDYLKHFGSSSDNRVVLCKVNPRDVVAIPNDYNNTKMRVCQYEVVADVTEKALGGDFLSKATVYKTDEYKVPSKFSNGKQIGVIGTSKDGSVCRFESAKEAERQMGIWATDITKCCKGVRKTAGGLYWKYA